MGRSGNSVAYFSMEIAIEPKVPTYSGGLGVLAGDMLRAAADLDIPMVGVSLLHRQGYFRQSLDHRGTQSEAVEEWNPEDWLTEMPQHAAIWLESREVHIRAWRYVVHGPGGGEAVAYFIDTMLPENDPQDRELTGQLYGGDERHRLRQEAILGLGGVAMLRALGYRDLAAYHLNEGHSALLAVALLREQLTGRRLPEATREDIAAVRKRCVFTTHTPVPEGHDQFPLSLAEQVLGDETVEMMMVTGCCPDGVLNMTYLGLFFSRYINGVAMRHGDISRGMFPKYPINSVTNGVHAPTWTAPAFREVFDRHLPHWRQRNSSLRYAVSIPLHEIARAHEEQKRALVSEVGHRTGFELSPTAFTIGVARRATSYKRADLIVSDLDRLRQLATAIGPLQMVFAGKAHPRDEGGKGTIRRIFDAAQALGAILPIVYLEDYDMDIAGVMCAGSDLWLNTPVPPREASGTSGMKAALNGVPSLSVLDGWWVEGHVEGVTGWSIGSTLSADANRATDATALYDKLERVILPLFFGNPAGYGEVMRSAIALNGSFFTAERMVLEYAANAYVS